MIIGLPIATDDNNNNNNVGLKIIAFGYLSIYLSIYLSMQGGGVVGGGGGTGAPTAMSQLWGGPACKRLRTPDITQMRGVKRKTLTPGFIDKAKA